MIINKKKNLFYIKKLIKFLIIQKCTIVHTISQKMLLEVKARDINNNNNKIGTVPALQIPILNNNTKITE